MNDLVSEQIIYEGKYFCIYKEIYTNRKTPIYTIYDKNTICIGKIKWYGAWRKFCFFPEGNTIWDSICLEEVIALLCQYNKERLDNKNIRSDIE